MAINKVIFIGRLTAEPQLEHIPQKTTKVVNFTLAQNRTYNNEISDFLNCTAWNKTAELIVQNLTKGSLVAIVGSYQSTSYVDRDGNKRYGSSCVVQEINFLQSKPKTPKDKEISPQEDVKNMGTLMDWPDEVEQTKPIEEKPKAEVDVTETFAESMKPGNKPAQASLQETLKLKDLPW